MKIYDEEGYIDSDVHEILYELGNVGIGMASVTVGNMIGLRMNVGVPSIVPAKEIMKKETMNKKRKAGILMDFQRSMEGSMLFLLDEEFVNEVIKITCESGSIKAEEMDEADKLSVLEEFANITSAAYLKAVGQYTGMRLFVKPVWMKFECIDRLLDEVTDRMEKNFSKAVCVDASYSIVYEDGNKKEDVGHVIMLPDEKSVEALVGPLMDEM
ncbi:MAG: hypothetical protein HFH64_04300 [Lachnospiraceae bacterium]|nr:hypothetical protein [Lachnospiraceae bacterium]